MKFKTLLVLIVAAIYGSTLSAADLTDKHEISIFGGGVQSGGGAGLVGGNFGYGFTSKAIVFGEFSQTFVSGPDITDFQGGLKYTLANRGKLEPYGLASLGVGRSGGARDLSGPGRTYSFEVNLGIGARYFYRTNWGFQPEIRWVHYGASVDALRYTGGLFLQW